MHVKGHSADGGNDAADERVQWGKGLGPFARLWNRGGEGDSRFGAADAAAGGATDVALGLDGEIELDEALEALLADADALVGQAAAGNRPAALGSHIQVLNSENSLATRNVCSNGVLLESPN